MEKLKVVYQTTKVLNKKGEIKGKNKKETKSLKGACPHHKYNKKMKMKPTIFRTGDDYAICEACGARFPVKVFEDEELNARVKSFEEMNNQAKYIAVAVGAGNEAADYFSKLGSIIKPFQKHYKKIRTVAQKKNSINKKKNKKGNRIAGGSAQYGSWGSN
jgi:hypothetical protein